MSDRCTSGPAESATSGRFSRRFRAGWLASTCTTCLEAALLALAALGAALSPAWGLDEFSRRSTSAPSDVFRYLEEPDEGISANPGAVNVLTGTGWLGEQLGFAPESGIRIGGLWMGDANYLFAGGVDPRNWTFNSVLLLDVSFDLDRLLGIPGALFGIEFLQFNGQETNDQAGTVAGYNSLPGPPPLDRSELYELWWRQELFDDRLILRIGKSVTTADFNNVVRPLSLKDETLAIRAVSALIYTPIFVNATLLGAMPGFYNSAYGIVTTLAPTRNFYVSAGAYDGNLARGVQTGIEVLPEFNGYYFTVGEIGYAWHRGPLGMPGTVAVGGWEQTGELSAASPNGSAIAENGAQGIYTFGNQRVWLRNPGVDNSGISVFFQFGINDSDTLPVNAYFGAGFTGFGLVPQRPRDSLGAGVAVSWLNEKLGFRDDEVMLAAYYQFHMIGDVFLQPTVTYIPNPGQSPSLSPATALTLRVTSLF